jgi:hypothetical protein
MKKLVALRKIVKLLHPNLEIIVRNTKGKDIQLIVKNVWYTEFDIHNLYYTLIFKNGEVINADKFLDNIIVSYPYSTRDNTSWKYIMTNGKVYNYGK